jgi:O-antigen/teichoic acid export membrane protein
VITGFYSQKRHKEINQLYTRVSRWVFFVNFPIFLVIAVFSRHIIKILFGQDYVAGGAALTILAIGHLIYSLSYTSSNILSMAKKTRTIFIISLIFAGSNLVLNYFLIPLYGVNGAAIATSISFVIGAVLIILFTSKLTRIYPFDRFFLKPFLASLLSIGFTYYLTNVFFEQLSLFRFALIFSVFVLLYACLLFLLRSFEKEDFDIIREIIRAFSPSKQNLYRALNKVTLRQ